MKILFVSQMPWRILRQRPQHLALILARKGHSIVYVNSPVGLNPSLFSSLTRDGQFFFLRMAAKRLWLCNIFLPPFLGKLGFLSRKFGPLTLKIYLRYLQFKPDAAIFYSPRDTFLLKGLRTMGVKIFYDCVDDFSAFSNVANPSKVLDFEGELAKNSTVIIASSRTLCEKRSQIHPHCYYVPNGVEFSHFHEAFRSMEAPEEVRHLSHPIIGIMGNIQDWIDIDLICDLADSHPEYQILIVGPIHFGELKLKSRSNITMVGHKEYAVLPEYLASMDVCLIPFKINQLTKASNPIKMYEYLAAGKPVVSTALPEVQENAADLVSIAVDKTDFVRKVELAIADLHRPENEGLVLSRLKFARQNSWEKRVEVIEELLKRYASNKQQSS